MKRRRGVMRVTNALAWVIWVAGMTLGLGMWIGGGPADLVSVGLIMAVVGGAVAYHT